MFFVVLDNAIKFSTAGGSIDVTASKVGNRFVISIADHGIGIAEQDLPHIFERFYKTQSAQNQNGSGLGLAIAKQIADRHGIVLSTNGTVVDKTEFVFTFPISSVQTESDHALE